MNKIAETFWIASAVVIGTALVVVAVPLLAIVVFLALALPAAIQRFLGERNRRQAVSPAPAEGFSKSHRSPLTIETTYTVLERSAPR